MKNEEKTPLKRYSTIQKQNSTLTNQKLNIQKIQIIKFILKKLFLITIILFCLNKNSRFLPFEKEIIKKFQNFFFSLNNKKIINKYLPNFIEFFSINFFFLTIIFLNKNKYRDLLIIFFVIFFRNFINILFQNSRPFWDYKFEVYLCKRNFSADDNTFFLIFIFFIIKNKFFLNNLYFFLAIFFFLLHKMILFINANIFFSGIILDLCFILFFYDIFFYTKHFFYKYDIFEKMTTKKIIYLFFIWVFFMIILNIVNSEPIDIIKFNKFENIVF